MGQKRHNFSLFRSLGGPEKGRCILWLIKPNVFDDLTAFLDTNFVAGGDPLSGCYILAVSFSVSLVVSAQLSRAYASLASVERVEHSSVRKAG